MRLARARQLRTADLPCELATCVMQSSDMNASMLAEQVAERVIGFDFGTKEDIVAVTIIYPIDFLPAA
jgi:hypothetical protein